MLLLPWAFAVTDGLESAGQGAERALKQLTCVKRSGTPTMELYLSRTGLCVQSRAQSAPSNSSYASSVPVALPRSLLSRTDMN